MKLFQIEKMGSSGNQSNFIAKVDSSHNIFKGHFPENPVVPGVCTMAMVKECCEMILSRSLRYDSVREVKFLSAIVPTLHSELLVNVEVDEQMNLKAMVMCGEQTVMKLKATLV